MIYFQVEEIDSFDGCFKNVILRNNNIVIPYVNLGISNHPLNQGNKLKYINYAYLVAEDVSFLATWVPKNNTGKHFNIIGNFSGTKTLFWGGANLDSDSIFCDLRLSCKTAFIQLLGFSELSETIWPVVDSQPSNMDQNIVEEFFDGKFMPDNIRELIK